MVRNRPRAGAADARVIGDIGESIVRLTCPWLMTLHEPIESLVIGQQAFRKHIKKQMVV
jgi:hypothetical protein